MVLQFTDEPVPPAPPHQGHRIARQNKPKSALRSTIEALRKAAGGLRAAPPPGDLFGDPDPFK